MTAVLAHAPEFFVVAAIVIVTPGPDTALTIRNTLLGGRRAGVHTAIGVSTGQTLWAAATAFGVAALLAASEPAFRALKLAGAAYLVYLGAQSLLAALRGAHRTHAERTGTTLRPAVAFRQGVISNLGNPKMAAFFLSLLPQFASGETTLVPLLALGLVFSTMTLAWLSAYAVAVARAGDFLRRGAVRRVLDAVVGAVLVALGIRVAVERK
jgi:threonine/homoserine/homoserine lactone efflux protein